MCAACVHTNPFILYRKHFFSLLLPEHVLMRVFGVVNRLERKT